MMLGSLFAKLLQRLLARLEPLRVRFGDTIRLTAAAAAMALAALLLGLLGAVGLGVAAGLALAIVIPGWAAALVVAGLLLVLGAGLGAAATRTFRTVSGSRPAGRASPTDSRRGSRPKAGPTR